MVLGILGSGSGSNMQAILDAIDAGTLDARISIVLSDNPDAYILERARKRGIATGLIDCRGFKTRFPEEAQQETAGQLKAAGVELVCLAGFLRLVKRPLLDAFPNRILNIHRNVPGVLRDINKIVSDMNANIRAQVLSTDPDIGYLVMDLDQDVSQDVKKAVASLSTSIKTRILF